MKETGFLNTHRAPFMMFNIETVGPPLSVRISTGTPECKTEVALQNETICGRKSRLDTLN